MSRLLFTYGWSVFLIATFFYFGWQTHQLVMHYRTNKMLEKLKDNEPVSIADVAIQLNRLI